MERRRHFGSHKGVKRHRPTPAGSISVVPASSSVWARSSGHKDELHLFLEAGLVSRVAALSLAEVALRAGFSDQSQFSRHFKRLVGVTPRQFEPSSRIA